jgi:signal transduction histidine kinase
LLKGGVNEIELTVRDLGIGFDPGEAIKGRGLGLTIPTFRRERADAW